MLSWWWWIIENKTHTFVNNWLWNNRLNDVCELLVGIWQKHLETQSDWVEVDVAQVVVGVAVEISSCKHTQLNLCAFYKWTVKYQQCMQPYTIYNTYADMGRTIYHTNHLPCQNRSCIAVPFFSLPLAYNPQCADAIVWWP